MFSIGGTSIAVCKRHFSTRSLSVNPIMNSPFGSTCPYPLTVPPVLSHDMDELHQMYTDLILGMELAVPGTGPDTLVTLSRSRYDLIKGLFPVEWSLGVAKIGGGHYQYPHDVDDEERAFLFAREAIVKERPGVIVLGPLTEQGDILANCEYSNFVDMLIQSAREARPETKVVWDETLVGTQLLVLWTSPTSRRVSARGVEGSMRIRLWRFSFNAFLHSAESLMILPSSGWLRPYSRGPTAAVVD